VTLNSWAALSYIGFAIEPYQVFFYLTCIPTVEHGAGMKELNIISLPAHPICFKVVAQSDFPFDGDCRNPDLKEAVYV